MSVVNKARDRDANGRINRKYTRNISFRSKVRSRGWDNVYHNRPCRRRANALCRAIAAGADPEDVVWPSSVRPGFDWL